MLLIFHSLAWSAGLSLLPFFRARLLSEDELGPQVPRAVDSATSQDIRDPWGWHSCSWITLPSLGLVRCCVEQGLPHQHSRLLASSPTRPLAVILRPGLGRRSCIPFCSAFAWRGGWGSANAAIIHSNSLYLDLGS